MLAAAQCRPTDVVVEIGPGLGVLTQALADQAERVIAVELDERMGAILEDLARDWPNVTVVQADVLDVDPAQLAGRAAEQAGPSPGFLVVANLPYYITSAVLRHVLEARVKPERVVVMVQKEVADRIVAAPGQLSILAVAVAYFASATIVAHVPASAFYPAPKVDSAILRLEVHSSPPVNVPSEAAFFRVVRAGFSQRRKQLRNSLTSGLGLEPMEVVAAMTDADVSPDRRAQTLSLEEWASLAHALAKMEKSD